MIRSITIISAIGIIAASVWSWFALSEAHIAAEDKRSAPVSFERDVQPILVAKCAKCHGGSKAEGGLKLTDLAAATAELDSGEKAIVPGQTGESELLRRVMSNDDDQRMPPAGPPLSADQIVTLKQWIASGANWPAHWAYRPLRNPPIPVALNGNYSQWPRTPIDSFILKRLDQQGLSPSPPADRRTLLRRVYFDLTGLPPTPEQVDAFENDQSPDAYERVVDRLLTSPRYGERFARHWMDVVHYAETHGHDQDRPRENAWPYRDYLIRSFNEDKPYAKFVQEQLAGDLLFPGDPQSIVATGMLATGPWDESSLRDIREDTLDREIARYMDRDDIVTTVMSTFVSSTVHCARCHDHKFDPIRQQDYYALQAVFAGTDKANRAYDPDPQVATRRLVLNEQLAKLSEFKKNGKTPPFDRELAAEVALWEKSIKASVLVWQILEPAEFKSSGGATLTKISDGSIFSGGTRPEKDTVTVVANTGLKRVTAIRLDVLTDDRLSHKGPGRQDNGNLHLSELIVEASPTDQPTARQRVTLINPKADFNQTDWTIAMAVDNNPATAWGIYPAVGKSHHAVFELKTPIEFEGGVTLTFQVKQIHGGGHLIGRLRLLATTTSGPWISKTDPLPVEISSILSTEAEKRSDAQITSLSLFFLERRLNRQIAALPPQQLVYCGTNRFKADGTFRPASKPRSVHLLRRGEITKPGPIVEPAALSVVPGLDIPFKLSDPENEGERRAALARWITDARNVLTWRSIANRIWHYHFGRGIVDTPNDFGRMGGVPSHPELLDWMAVKLQAGGSLKSLHRLIVTSQVYQQSSQRMPKYTKLDADNRYLWRMNRPRLDAESVRDAVLQISGRIDLTMGGPSVKQFIQTPGVHVTPKVDYVGFDADHPANQRRSVYRFVFRTLPDPFMEALDCPDASQLSPRRNTSLTALSALAMLNDKFIVRHGQHLAQRVKKNNADRKSQVTAVYRLIFGRTPTPQESQAVTAYATKYGLANACRVLLNSNEFIFLD